MVVWACLAAEARSAGRPKAAHPVEVSGNVNVNSKGISLVPALDAGPACRDLRPGGPQGRVSFEPQFRFATRRQAVVVPAVGTVSRGLHRQLPAGHRRAPGVFVQDVDRRGRRAVARPNRGAPVSRGGRDAHLAYVTEGQPRRLLPLLERVRSRCAPSTRKWLPRERRSRTSEFVRRARGACDAAALLPPHQRAEGTYVSANASFGRRGSPWSISAIVNQPISSEVTGGKNFLWNVGVNYAFR